ncbi:hypothetical protein U4E84_09670 [Halorubrum sp. AD140]|uniref:hypothetical protein n=1 Tax=Halorubrum sp. AD140 TaxID=3050073 RepID=UPI002ACCDA1B|nr:hypothetical protein [Halorubrum sp. AD140]MDZ5811611.1 hypothetical protein [Halorubrum sp. AD140]
MSLGHSGSFTAEKDREFFCDTCGARCTRSINGDLEYGHLIGCPDRPEAFSFGTSDHVRKYSPEDDANDGGASA